MDYRRALDRQATLMRRSVWTIETMRKFNFSEVDSTDTTQRTFHTSNIKTPRPHAEVTVAVVTVQWCAL